MRSVIDEITDEAGEGIVVPELDLLGGNRVVFIDDGHHPITQKGPERTARIEIAFAARDIIMSEQDLGSDAGMRLKGLLPHANEAHLAHRRSRLQFIQRVWPFPPAKPDGALRHGARGDDDHFMTCPANLGDLPSPIVNAFCVQPRARTRGEG